MNDNKDNKDITQAEVPESEAAEAAEAEEVAEAVEVAEAAETSEKPSEPVDIRRKQTDNEKDIEKYEKHKAALAAKEARLVKSREAYRTRRLAKHDKDTQKLFEDIDKSEEREKSKTNDATEKREIELLAIKKREELKQKTDQQRRVIASSTGNRISYERRKALYGYGFISIWIIGVLLVFIGPLITSLQYSMSEITLVSGNNIEEYGMERAGFHQLWVGFENYRYAMVDNGNYPVDLAASLGGLVPQVIMVLIFSLFVAILLNQKFKGRTVMRAIFFFPVLIASGPVIAVINGSIMSQGIGGDAAQFSTMFQTDMVDEFMRFLGLYNLSEKLTTFIGNITSDIFNLLWKSGIQILIFLSALQQIPTSAKEAASMEGATAWEFFWKITFPTISPMILANLIYTIIDTFSDAQNIIMKNHVLVQISAQQYGYATAMAWIYFGIIALALGLVVGIVSRFVFYAVD